MQQRSILSRVPGVVTLAVLTATPSAMKAQPAADARAFDFHQADVLGTAMDLTVVAANRADADAAEKAVLDEITRLRKILSAYDADAELARVNASPVNGPGVTVSTELIDVLKRYDGWAKRSRSAYSGHLGDVLALWKKAEMDGQLPDDAQLAAAAAKNRPAAWEIDESAKTVRRVSDQQINVDSLGKGFIIDKAVAAATRSPTKIKGLLLNIGGDLRTWGRPAADQGPVWAVGLQDPDRPQLNAKPLTTVFAKAGQSVSSSGGYQRFYTVAGKQYSHIIDARTGQPARNKAATVIANDSATANALATICCTLRFAEAFELVRAVPGAQALIVTADGAVLRTDGFKEAEDKTRAIESASAPAASQFPAGFALAIDLEVVPTSRRPYVFVWVTDAAGKHVKTLAAYGNDPKWQPEMREWWKVAAADRKLKSITHATQAAGKYPLAWDGTNQAGSGVPLGAYKVWVEVSAEHGPYAVKVATIDLSAGPKTATIAESSAFKAVNIRYGPGAK